MINFIFKPQIQNNYSWMIICFSAGVGYIILTRIIWATVVSFQLLQCCCLKLHKNSWWPTISLH